jgi:cytoskeletal protein CcmA (bactofilin family)
MLSWRKRPRARYRSTELSAYLDERSDIEGTYTFSGTAMLNGKLEGVIQSTDTLIVGEKGVVNANITVGCVLISGEVVGNVLATERIELRDGARVFGDIEAPVVVIEEGVLFEGHCRMTKTRAAEAATPPRPVSDKPEALGQVGVGTCPRCHAGAIEQNRVACDGDYQLCATRARELASTSFRFCSLHLNTAIDDRFAVSYGQGGRYGPRTTRS